MRSKATRLSSFLVSFAMSLIGTGVSAQEKSLVESCFSVGEAIADAHLYLISRWVSYSSLDASMGNGPLSQQEQFYVISKVNWAVDIVVSEHGANFVNQTLREHWENTMGPRLEDDDNVTHRLKQDINSAVQLQSRFEVAQEVAKLGRRTLRTCGYLKGVN